MALFTVDIRQGRAKRHRKALKTRQESQAILTYGMTCMGKTSKTVKTVKICF